MESASAHPTTALSNITIDEMDEQKLVTITADAVGTILFFRTKHLYPASAIRDSGIDSAVKAVFHLRSQAKDIAVAYMDIACDAAVGYAQDWNDLHPEDTMSPRWMYNCVQSLLSETLKPDLVDALAKEKPIQRLKDWVKTQQTDAVSNDNSPLTSGDEDEGEDAYDDMGSIAHSAAGSLTNTTSAADEDDDDTEPSAASFIKAQKTPWTNDDISQMIKLHAKGFTHREASVVLGRRVGAVENKYGRVAKEDAWKPYIVACATRFAAEKKRRDATRRLAATRKHKLGAGVAKARAAGRGEEDEEEEDVQSVIEVTAGAAARRVGGYAKRRRVMTVAEAAGLE